MMVEPKLSENLDEMLKTAQADLTKYVKRYRKEYIPAIEGKEFQEIQLTTDDISLIFRKNKNILR